MFLIAKKCITFLTAEEKFHKLVLDPVRGYLRYSNFNEDNDLILQD